MADFAERLAELKRQGSAVLVTGSDATEGHVELCRGLLGDDSVEPRRRVVVVSDGMASLETRLPTERGAVPDTTVISAAATRSAAANDAAAPRGVDVVDVEGESMGDIGGAIAEAVERVQRRHAPLEPGELRLGVDSLAPLLDAHGEREVFAFLVVATRYLRANRALGHVHLPVERDAYVSRLLAPLFDVVVEVRTRNGTAQQRWHLDDGAVTSRWLSL